MKISKIIDLLRIDICDINFLERIFNKYKFDSIIHLAAESHVDRSITNPLNFVNTNVIGTVNLLNQFKDIHKVVLMENYFIM